MTATAPGADPDFATHTDADRDARPDAPLTLADTPRGVRRFAWGLGFLFLALIPVLLLAPWTQTVHGTGRAVAFDPVQRPQTVVSPIQGRVLKWHVKEGDRVKPGDRLVDLVDNDPRRLEMLREQRQFADQRRTLAKSGVQEQESRLANVKREAPSRVAEAKARAEAAEAGVPRVKQVLLQANAEKLRAGQVFDRAEDIFRTPVAGMKEGGALSKDQLEQATRELTIAKERVPLVQAEVTVAEKQSVAAAESYLAVVQQTQSMVNGEELLLIARKDGEAAAVQQFLSIDSEVKRQENQFVAASTAGTVFRVLANAEAGGQLVNPGQQLAVLVPDVAPTTLTDSDTPGIVAEVTIDGNDLPLVRKGDRAILQFEGWAAVQFAAYPAAAAGTFEGRVYLVDPTSDGQGRFRILVEPAPGADWPEPAFLRQGVRVQGWVLIKEVTLGYELWRLLNGFPPAREVKEKESRQVLGFGPVERK